MTRLLSVFFTAVILPLATSPMASVKITRPFQPPTYEVGPVGSKDRVVGKFMLRNVGRQELVLRSVRRNCACYLISHTDNRLQPGESMTFTFDLTFPKDKRLRNAVFYILSNDREKPLRLFKVKLTQSYDPDFAASEPDQLILQPLDESLATMDDLEAINRQHNVASVRERSPPHGGRQYVLQFREGTDMLRAAKAYAEHPSVGLVLFRASCETSVAEKSDEPPPPTPAHTVSESHAPKKRRGPLTLHWFYSEGCAFCDEVKSLMCGTVTAKNSGQSFSF
jgi:hypothetical protein